jgi:uncharacterized protein YndB with AHSA1/START domain
MTLQFSLLFSASREQLFDAWTRKDLVEQWLFKNDTNSLRADLDPRPGGKFFILESDGGKVIDHFGEYLEVRRPERLAFTLAVPAHFQGQSRIELDFQTVTSDTEMHFMQTGVETDLVEAQWRMMFQNLTRLLLRE